MADDIVILDDVDDVPREEFTPQSSSKSPHNRKKRKGKGKNKSSYYQTTLPTGLVETRPKAALEFVETIEKFATWDIASRKQAKDCKAIRKELEGRYRIGLQARPRTAGPSPSHTRRKHNNNNNIKAFLGPSSPYCRPVRSKSDKNRFIGQIHNLFDNPKSAELEYLEARRDQLTWYISKLENTTSETTIPPDILQFVTNLKKP